jgi:pyruvate,water dikinase
MFIKNFGEIDKDMFEECGGKASHLGELTSLKLNVPKGFNVVGNAFYHHLKKNHLEEQIREIAETVNYEDYKDLEEKTQKIREIIVNAPIPQEIEQEIFEHYERLCSGEQNPFVAVRSSVAVKDSPISSFPGMMDTFHYIQGAKNVVEKVKECWASVWSGRATFSRHSKGIGHTKAIIAPTIQLMVNSEVAGVLFTVNPITGSKEDIVIESNWGLGETVVSGKSTSDLYIMNKNPFRIKDKKIARKHQTFVQDKEGGAKWVEVEPDKINQPTLSDSQIEELCKIGRAIEDHYGCPQDIEWAYEKGLLYILQARRAKAGGE